MRISCANVLLLTCLAISLGPASAGQEATHEEPNQTRGSAQQETALSKLVLSGDPVVTSQPVLDGFVGPIRCSYGKLYIRPIPPNTTPLLAPLVGLALDGKSKVQFDLKTVPDFAGKQPVAPIHAVDRFGNAYFFVRVIDPGTKDHSHEKNYVVKFSADGTYSSTSTLDRTLWPYAMAVFPSGNIFISGLDHAPYEEDANSASKSIIGIFDIDGRMKLQLKSSRDDGLEHHRLESHDGDAENAMVQFGDALIGPGDLLYLSKYGREPRIEVWSEAGQQIRELRLKPPFSESTTHTLLVAEGTIAVEFEGPTSKDPKDRRVVWGIFDSYTGEPRGYYDESFKGRMVCLEGQQFTYMVMKAGYYALQRVEPQ